MANFLVIEDNAAQRAALEEFLGALGKKDEHRVYSAPELELARAVLAERPIDIILSDLMLPDGMSIELVREVRTGGRLRDIPILILTGQPSIETAVEAIREGASDYLLKPVDLTLLRKKMDALLETSRLKTENRQLRQRLSETFRAGSIVGNSSSLQDVLERVKQIAPTDVTVLIEGESGVGKELIANLLHENSPRASRPFVKVNCGALTKSILESELFGAVKGAYTGADHDRAGFFEAANGGTIFLDEIGEMDAESQVRLLRVLESREVVRIGSTRPIAVDVRVVAATNRSLLDEADHGRFREDLYYRLAVIRLFLPPLRQRGDDIPLLFNHFVTQFNDRYGKSVRGLSADLQAFFQNYDWPGNIREFRNVLEGMVVLARDDVLGKEDLPPELLRAPPRASARKLAETIVAGVSMEDYEKAILERNLNFYNGNREQTASALGISERTLYRKIKDFRL
ncbi:MAG: sigma-54 dependent transcriptional regulator [Leptospirales bacterium]|nr:sigma-54 dependent transcriptional regulator [Leptospirales bacterium]